MQSKHVQDCIAELQVHYPHAFKGQFLFYSLIKTKGIWDDRKELLPWLLAAMIFIPICMLLKQYIVMLFPQFSTIQHFISATLVISLFLMLIAPFIIQQVKHSSYSLYPLLQNIPFKLTVVILLQGLNFAYLQSYFALWLLFFLSLSFGFVRLYKENMFKDNADPVAQYQLQQLRRLTYWSYKQTFRLRLRLRFTSRSSTHYSQLEKQLKSFADLYTQLLKLEHQFCKSIKHIDVDSYLDEML